MRDVEHLAILSHVDHTLLAPDATEAQLQALCTQAMRYHTASVCIPPNRVKQACALVGSSVRVGTVIGFPNGYATTESKCFEAENALQNGATELDTVIPIGLLKEGREEAILQELTALKKLCGSYCLKVIIETCLLNTDEKTRMCELVAASGADYIKTSTGFSCAGATVEDIRLFSSVLQGRAKIKAAGGISDWETAGRLLEAGADRLGSSKLVLLYEKERGGSL